jgi:hypothetical protein
MRPRRTNMGWHRTQRPTPSVQPIQIRDRDRLMKTESVGADILLEAHQLVTGPRNDTYGNVVDDYTKVITIFEGLTGIKLSLSDALLFMVSVKMARLRTNLDRNRLHHDSLLDALGYLGLLNQAYNDLPFPRTVAER